ncbi:DUF3472 domain-containing protein [Collimonas humicola]|uniref:DUF3472 domain-containing protein n=1 Tax=Collimonas humicola TaxID=2825886 RepID=UPI001B8A8FFF|nr:ricin-type beta-trefoil lectin domain protein [Collimonas humicola]
MNWLLKLILSAVLISGSFTSVAAYAVVAGGMAVVDRSWPQVSDGYSDMEFTITITKEPGYDGRTYWAHQWDYTGSKEGGYVGLQSTSGNNKILNFAIWGATGWQNSEGANCSNFGHEGNGVQCSTDYLWEEGTTYQIRIEKSGDSGWTASIKNTWTNASKVVATILVPQSYGGLASLSEWVENFAQGDDQHPSCSAVPQAIAVYGMPKANGGTVSPSGSNTYTYGNCAAIAKTVCTTEQVCTMSVNPSPSLIQKQLKNESSGYCLDMLGGGSVAGLWHCTNNNNQVFTQDDNFRFHQSSNDGFCLTADSNDVVKTSVCNNSAHQQWLKVNRTGTFFNAGTGQCMDPRNNAALEAPVGVYQCLGNDFQRWSTIP